VALAPFHDHADSVPADVQDMLVALKADLEAGTIPTCVWVTDAPGCEVAPEPVFGGTLRVGLEAETDGLNPAVNRFAASAYQMGAAVYDYLVGVEDTPCQCVYKPILAESWTSSDDNVTWDFKLREGVKFHDGTTLNSEAVLHAFKMQLNDPTVGIAVRALFLLDDPETEYFEPAQIIDEYTIRFHAPRPHVDFPGIFTTQLGMIPSLAYMQAAGEDGSLNQAPVGTGPFMFDSREQDNMTRFVRNPDYWQGDVYLDAIEFYIYTDGEIAASALAVGDIDAMGTSNVDAILAIRDLADDGYTVLEGDMGDDSFGVTNVTHPPFDDIRARQALTYAFPRDDYVEFIGAGVLRPADQVFTPEELYYNPNIVQEHDTPDLATPLVAEYCADVPEMCTDGKINMEYQYSGPSVIQDRIYDLLTDGWSDHFNVTKDMKLQDEHITEAILGIYDFMTWRQFGSLNPDGHILWTSCEAIGALSLNWPRECDPVRDEAMFAARASDDREGNREYWDTFSQSIHDGYAYLFLTHTMWTHGYAPGVANICGYEFPDGTSPRCHTNGGNPGWAHFWIEE
jgi:peptide/nickel transport system substrate-binding protein